MIAGLGNDIIEVQRIKTLLEKYGSHFLDKTFTKDEQEYCDRYSKKERHYAGRYAAKEAIVKAFGLGFGAEIGFLDISIINDIRGKPIVILSPKVQEALHHPNILLSISHCHEYATAVAIVLE